VLVTRTLPLAVDSPDTWAPDGIDEIVAAAVSAAAAEAADTPIAEEPPAPVEFTITSNPSDALVFFDDILVGNSPARVEVDLSVGHAIRIEADGYDPLSWSFDDETLTDDQRASREFFFPLNSSVPPGFFMVDNQQYGYPVEVTVVPRGNTTGSTRTYEASASHNIQLRPGSYRVRLSAPSIFWADDKVATIRSDERQTAALPRPVTVQIVASPGNCTIFINGTDVGVSPVTQALAAGTEYTFTFDWSAIGEGTRNIVERVTRNGQRIVGEKQNAGIVEVAFRSQKSGSHTR